MDRYTSAIAQKNYSVLLGITNTPITNTAEIDQFLKPVLVELVPVDGPNENKPAFKKLLAWLMHPQRTVEEINYVLGSLGEEVFWKEHYKFLSNKSDTVHKPGFPTAKLTHAKVYTSSNRQPPNEYFIPNPNSEFGGHSVNLAHAVIESMARKLPIIEDKWQITALLIARQLKYLGDYDKDKDDEEKNSILPVASEHLSQWIFEAIGCTETCPSPYIRVQLIFLLRLVPIRNDNQIQAVKALMSACSVLSIDHLPGYYLHTLTVDFMYFCNVVAYVVKNDSNPDFNLNLIGQVPLASKCLSAFGEELGKKLMNLKTMRLGTLTEVSYQCATNPAWYSDPRELRSVIALIDTLTMYTKHLLNSIGGPDDDPDFIVSRGPDDDPDFIVSLVLVHDMFFLLIFNFEPCFKKQCPQLISHMAKLIINVVELVSLWLTTDNDRSVGASLSFANEFELPLQIMMLEKSEIKHVITPIGREVTSRYALRLRAIRDIHGDAISHILPTICILLNPELSYQTIMHPARRVYPQPYLVFSHWSISNHVWFSHIGIFNKAVSPPF